VETLGTLYPEYFIGAGLLLLILAWWMISSGLLKSWYRYSNYTGEEKAWEMPDHPYFKKLYWDRRNRETEEANARARRNIRSDWEANCHQIPTPDAFAAGITNTVSTTFAVVNPIPPGIVQDYYRAYEVYKDWTWADAYENYQKFYKPYVDRPKFTFGDDARFFGQWIIGEPGAGKTTFISTMIAEDLKKVARNEASIFVMDSQNELVPDIARLEMFAPGRPLHDKLIYLEPNPDFPLALNIFDIDKKRVSSLSSSEERMMYEAGVEWMVDFFLKSLVKSDESSNQETFLAFVIPAVLAIPNATIFTMQDLLEPAKVKGGETGYDRYKQYFGKLREPTQRWLRDRLHSEKLAQTRNAVLSRLEGFSARGFFGDMFAHPKNKLDLFAELQNSKVILINTKGALLKKNLEPFGRYFIARLLQAAEERMFTERGNRLPVYAYIDEADQYIAEEENIEELINKARKQKVGLIIANQMESHIKLPIVREALGRMAIQCRGQPPMRKGDAPTWHIQLGKQEPAKINFPDTQFSKMPRMSEAQFREMLKDMQDRYCSPAHSDEFEETEAEQPHYQEPPKQRSDAPKDDEYDDRYDQLDKITLSPTKARMGTVITVNCPNGRSHQQAIPAGVHNGYRFCVKGASRIRRPDNRNGNYWVELEIAEMPRARKPPGDETDAKPW
jgi:hypothetical protein